MPKKSQRASRRAETNQKIDPSVQAGPSTSEAPTRITQAETATMEAATYKNINATQGTANIPSVAVQAKVDSQGTDSASPSKSVDVVV